ncbi:hypothetical protein ASD64_07220 [Mesorhizobium sp. Root157]|uniref:DUF7168 domain-containing protein n=1 Tax=Mesorhizobium sp. Root157 TaxID=1736477 RepID=UPI0006FDCE56|nr:DUF2786 domain-containing protein [Mesorhizobium sp. Root157]KQZ87221.1 hypothetical protein ASD64_07220 [Mesorhizobium sp. Root157]
MSAASQKVRDRIRMLREKTPERGCTEAEALAAAEKVAQLMRDHGLSEADIVMSEETSPSDHGRSIKAKLWPVIGHCTNTAHVVIRGRSGAEVQFIGRAPGPEVAVYLREVCEGAITRAVREFKTTTFYRRRRGLKSKRAAVADFTDGMVNLLRWRLVDVFASTINEAAQADAATALAERYPDMGLIKQRKAPLRHSAARSAGWRAGARVTLAHGVGEADAPLQIGGAS